MCAEAALARRVLALPALPRLVLSVVLVGLAARTDIALAQSATSKSSYADSRAPHDQRALHDQRAQRRRANASESGEIIVLQVGEQTVISSDGVRSYSEGSRGIVDVRLTQDGSQFVLVAEQAGKTTLLFIMHDGRERLIEIEVQDETLLEESSVAGLRVQRVDNVRLDFYFVQLDRSNSFRVGVGYPDSLSAGNLSASFDFLSQSFQAATAVVEDQALLRLDMAQTEGWAKLKRQAALITENGKKATFSGGGEVNIPVQGSLATGIHRIAFGSNIEVLPRYDAATGRLRIELGANVSDLTDDRGSGVPGRMTSTINTVVNLRLGQTVVLAGLSAENQQRSRSGVPLLSQLPVFGALFGSSSSQQSSVENVVFIVPTVINASAEDARRKVEAAFRAYRDYSGNSEARDRLKDTWKRSGQREQSAETDARGSQRAASVGAKERAEGQSAERQLGEDKSTAAEAAQAKGGR